MAEMRGACTNTQGKYYTRVIAGRKISGGSVYRSVWTFWWPNNILNFLFEFWEKRFK